MLAQVVQEEKQSLEVGRTPAIEGHGDEELLVALAMDRSGLYRRKILARG